MSEWLGMLIHDLTHLSKLQTCTSWAHMVSHLPPPHPDISWSASVLRQVQGSANRRIRSGLPWFLPICRAQPWLRLNKTPGKFVPPRPARFGTSIRSALWASHGGPGDKEDMTRAAFVLLGISLELIFLMLHHKLTILFHFHSCS